MSGARELSRPIASRANQTNTAAGMLPTPPLVDVPSPSNKLKPCADRRAPHLPPPAYIASFRHPPPSHARPALSF